MTLNAVVSQKLLPGKEGGLHPAFELMRSNLAVRNLIRECQTHQIQSTLSAGKKNGMRSMDDSVLDLYERGLITREVAEMNCSNFESMQGKLNQYDKERASVRRGFIR